MSNNQKGFWNGEPATFNVVLYQVLPAEKETWWQNRHLGQQRQAVQITYGGQTWIIDNEHGDGYYKVTTGMGSPGCGHKSIDAHRIIRELPESEWKTEIDHAGLKAEQEMHDAWHKEHDPEGFERLMGLRETIREMQENRKL